MKMTKTEVEAMTRCMTSKLLGNDAIAGCYGWQQINIINDFVCAALASIGVEGQDVTDLVDEIVRHGVIHRDDYLYDD